MRQVATSLLPVHPDTGGSRSTYRSSKSLISGAGGSSWVLSDRSGDNFVISRSVPALCANTNREARFALRPVCFHPTYVSLVGSASPWTFVCVFTASSPVLAATWHDGYRCRPGYSVRTELAWAPVKIRRRTFREQCGDRVERPGLKVVHDGEGV